MSLQQNIPGEVFIKTISLYTDKGVLQMLEHVHHISIYESIFAPGVMVDLFVHDTKNIKSLLPILGSEKLTIILNTPGRKEAKYDLILTGSRNAIPSDNMRTKGYALTAMSPEVVRNKSNRVSKAYNTNVSSMVEDIIKSYLKTDKKIDVQTTRGIQKVIVPSLQPFEAINMLRRRSISIEDKSSAYVFFQNQEGFHFKTLENLFSQGKVGDRVFTNDPTLGIDVSRSHFRNVITWEAPDQFNVVDRLDEGGLAADIQKFDYKTLEYTNKLSKFKPQEYKNADGSLKDPDLDTLKQFGHAASKQIWVDHDSGNPDTFLSEGLGPQAGGTSLYGQGSILIHVMGDSELTAGQLIEAKLIETSTATEAPKEDHQVSGKYVIAFLHHIIGPAGANPRYTCSMECVKGGYKEPQS
jgi:hypothetical protein